MTGTRIVLLSLAIAAGMLGTPLRAEAQFRVGGTLGVVFDNPDDMLALGAEARYRFTNPRWAFQPRFTYFLVSDGNAFQLDGNLLYNFPTASAARAHSYAGVGVLLLNESFDFPGAESESNIGYNLVSGAMFPTSGSMQPFVHAQYSVIQDYPNHFTLSGGVSFAIAGGRSARRAPASRR